MNKLEFTLYAEPFSLNKAYYLKSFGNKSATKIRTKECREWGDRVLFQLQHMAGLMQQFREAFDEKLHAISIELHFFIPTAKFYTKAGHISIGSSDITNIEKMLVDLIFDARFHGRHQDGKIIENINVNDKFIVRMVSSKNPSKGKDYFINVVINRIDNPIPI